ncbi:MAG: DNA-3-methyladenine glycosylase I [Candidatus Palauibacterales bacterium]|nr:DNA-3-methyladenine glycosylase I [Candidatus Palauibacterales bacterium]MDP2482624.1 DNA-3-methyladenine glycosylase I [Candidatus Palauibacterales bacterium]
MTAAPGGRQKERCPWAAGSEALREYHDEEWGVAVHDDRCHFEFLILEGAQAGLSWTTILGKRDGYRAAFAAFDPMAVSLFGEAEREGLLRNPEIVRNRLKIRSAIGNARAFLEVQSEFGSFDAYIWRFTDGRTIRNAWRRQSDVPAETAESGVMSRDLKRRGFRFVGPTICYAYMQAVGLVNDHLVDCFRHAEV